MAKDQASSVLTFLGYASYPVSIIYEGFVYATALQGLLLLGCAMPLAAALAVAVAVLDGVGNIFLISPGKGAQALTNTDLNWTGSWLTLAALAINYVLTATASVLSLYYFAGTTTASLLAMVPAFIVTVAYSMLYSAEDVLTTVKTLTLKTSNAFQSLYQQSPAHFYRRSVESIIIFFMACVQNSYLVSELCLQLLCLPCLILPFQALAVITTMVVLLPRFEQLFAGDCDKKSDATRPSTLLGVLEILTYPVALAGSLLYLAVRFGWIVWIPATPFHFVSAVLVSLLIAAVFYNVLLTNIEDYSATSSISSARDWQTVLATFLNIASQVIRFITGMTFFYHILNAYGDSSVLDASLLCFIVNAVVSLLSFRYQQPKFETSIEICFSSYAHRVS